MSLYLRALEQGDGTWTCRFGLEELGVEPNLDAALYRLVRTASSRDGRHAYLIFLHHADGRFESRHASDPLPGEVGWAPRTPPIEP